MCARGARWVDRNILDEYPDADVGVFAIWQTVLGGDRTGERPAGVLDDPRVTHLWDDGLAIGGWLGEQPDLNFGLGLVWDAFYLFDAEAEFSTLDEHLEASGRTIIDDSFRLADAFE